VNIDIPILFQVEAGASLILLVSGAPPSLLAAAERTSSAERNKNEYHQKKKEKQLQSQAQTSTTAVATVGATSAGASGSAGAAVATTMSDDAILTALQEFASSFSTTTTASATPVAPASCVAGIESQNAVSGNVRCSGSDAQSSLLLPSLSTVAAEGRDVLRFPTTLTSHQRRLVHEVQSQRRWCRQLHSFTKNCLLAVGGRCFW
jgi:hypothetical protein